MANGKYDEYYKKAREELEEQLNREKAALQSERDAAVKSAEQIALDAKKSAEQKADKAIDQSSVERLVNERKLSERLANLGLSDSGYAEAARLGVDKEEERSYKAAEAEKKDALNAADRKFEALKSEAEDEYYKEIAKVEESYDKSAEDIAKEQVKADEKKAAEEKSEKEKAEKEKAQKADEKLKTDRAHDFKLLKLRLRRVDNSGDVYTNEELADRFGLIKDFADQYGGTDYAMTEYELETLCGILGLTAADYRKFYATYKPIKVTRLAPENNPEFVWGIPGTAAYRSSRGEYNYGL